MKKKALAAVFFWLFLHGQAQASWIDDFTDNFEKFGLDVAVENALADDVTPLAILNYVIENREKVSPHLSLKAIYCAGVDPDVVEEAAQHVDISFLEIKKALEQSIQECGSKLALQDRDVDDIVALQDRDKPEIQEEQTAVPIRRPTRPVDSPVPPPVSPPVDLPSIDLPPRGRPASPSHPHSSD